MVSPTGGWLRGMRASCLGGAGFILALVGHVAAGGAAPRPAVLALLAWLVGLAAVVLTAVRLSPVQVGVSLTSMQVVLHEIFMWLGAPADCLTTGASTPAGGHVGHGGPAVFECATGMAMAGTSRHSVFATTTMVGAHLAATAMTAALLAYGEKVLWFLAGCGLVPRWLRFRLAEPEPVQLVPSRAPRTLRGRFACGGVGLRGPPARSLLAIV